MPTPQQRKLFERYRSDFLGLEPMHDVATLDGTPARRRRIYLDATATALMPRIVWDSLRLYFDDVCANSHTHAHLAGRVTTEAIERSRALLGQLIGYDPSSDAVIFTGNGATGATNLLAEAVFPAAVTQLFRQLNDPTAIVRDAAQSVIESLRSAGNPTATQVERDLVVVSKMEHHSNMLPWIRAVGYERVRFIDIHQDGTLNLDHLRQILDAEGRRVRMVALTAVSNVTGMINPIHEVAALAHAVGAQMAIDAAQAAPHVPIAMHPKDQPGSDIDYAIISGHKLYAPGSRGVLVARKDLFNSGRVVGLVGGGAVVCVSTERGSLQRRGDRAGGGRDAEHPGNDRIGNRGEARLPRSAWIRCANTRQRSWEDALARLASNADVIVYGACDTARAPRAGVVAFNLRTLPHGLVAAALSDYFNIAVRNDCFCAQPYVKEQLATVPDIESAHAPNEAVRHRSDASPGHGAGVVRGVYDPRGHCCARRGASVDRAARAGGARAVCAECRGRLGASDASHDVAVLHRRAGRSVHRFDRVVARASASE